MAQDHKPGSESFIMDNCDTEHVGCPDLRDRGIPTGDGITQGCSTSKPSTTWPGVRLDWQPAYAGRAKPCLDDLKHSPPWP
jgi:hypothetical protein